MNSLASVNEYKVSEDIWDCPDQIDEEECTPQMPHFTKQFENTLKDNKGSSNKADFEKDFEGLRNPKIMYLKPNDQGITARFKKQSVTCRGKTKLINNKPNTYNAKTSSRRRGFDLAAEEKKLLRRISSDRILKMLQI
ncbi:unnamed protein product [Moneuplotes crassus]|uniref:Uncharacterized protein n=1 Tax=Euplotes crassus TaxID=5936 RepID=A0AAD1Y8G1_EUPCR|nr:unnamed protein product [Moneuplotes crassus]